MKVVIQRCKKGSVEISNKIYSSIDKGYVILVGFTHNDNKEIVDKIINKIINLRVFEDENGKMNRSILDENGSILSISQFTLYANASEGRRPSFTDAMNKEEAIILYDYFNNELNKIINTKTGIFGEDMKVNISNDGPVTIILDSNEL